MTSHRSILDFEFPTPGGERARTDRRGSDGSPPDWLTPQLTTEYLVEFDSMYNNGSGGGGGRSATAAGSAASLSSPAAHNEADAAAVISRNVRAEQRVDAAGAALKALADELSRLGSRISILKVKLNVTAGKLTATVEQPRERAGGNKGGGAAQTDAPADPILMHVVVRADLVSGLGWLVTPHSPPKPSPDDTDALHRFQMRMCESGASPSVSSLSRDG